MVSCSMGSFTLGLPLLRVCGMSFYIFKLFIKFFYYFLNFVIWKFNEVNDDLKKEYAIESILKKKFELKLIITSDVLLLMDSQ